MKSIDVLNKFNKEKQFNEWKINLIKDFDLLIIHIENDFKIYKASFLLKELKNFQLLSKCNSIEQVIEILFDYIDNDKIKITEDENRVNLIILSNKLNISNVELIIKKTNILCEEIIEKLIKEFKNLKEENNELKSRIKILEKKVKEKENYFENNEIIPYNIKKIKSINAHTDTIKSVQSFPSGNIISVSKDKSIKIYDNQLNIIQTIPNAHDASITYVSIKDDNTFVTCSFKTIKIWIKMTNHLKNEYSFNLNKTINNAHDDWINKVIYCLNGNIISCSEDNTIKIWEKNNYQCIKILEHKDCVVSILLLEDKNILISSGNDGTKFWNLNKYNKIAYFKEVICFGVNALKRIDNDRIIIGGNDEEKKTIIILIKEKKIIKEIDNEFVCWGVCVIQDKGMFLVGGMSYHIKIYRSDNYECIKTIKDAHNGYILGINELKDNIIISYGIDKIIKVWSFS